MKGVLKHWDKPLYLLAVVILCRWASYELDISMHGSKWMLCAGSSTDIEERVMK